MDTVWGLASLKGKTVSEAGVLFDIVTGNTYALNPVATAVLRAVQEGYDQTKVVSLLLERFEVDPATLDRDLQAFVNHLKFLNLL